jgi:hypothetical protein
MNGTADSVTENCLFQKYRLRKVQYIDRVVFTYVIVTLMPPVMNKVTRIPIINTSKTKSNLNHMMILRLSSYRAVNTPVLRKTN